MPVLFVAGKGTRFHILSGRIEIALASAILVAAVCIVFNPAYDARLGRDIAHYGWSQHVSKLLFVWIWGYFFYFFSSALRIWSRWHNGPPMTRGPVDFGLTAVALALGGAGAVIAVLRLVNGPMDWPRLVPMSAALLVFGILDIKGYVRPSGHFEDAYLAHGSRLYFAWWMLLMGPLLRSHFWGGASSLSSSILVIGLYVALRSFWLRQLRIAGSAPTDVPRSSLG